MWGRKVGSREIFVVIHAEKKKSQFRQFIPLNSNLRERPEFWDGGICVVSVQFHGTRDPSNFAHLGKQQLWRIQSP